MRALINLCRTDVEIFIYNSIDNFLEGLYNKNGRYILYVGDDHVQIYDCIWWAGVSVTPLPMDWVVHACYHLPTQELMQIQSQFQN